MTKRILNTAFYKFVDLSQGLELRRAKLKQLCNTLNLKGTILLSPEGINGFLAGNPDAITEFRAYLAGLPEFSGLTYKDSWTENAPFKRMKVKLKKEIITMGMPQIKPAEWTGPRIEPIELKKWLDEGRKVHLVDTRNDYEVEYGTFEGALTYALRSFKEFPSKLEEIKSMAKPGEPVVMFCTGGIRCEKATAVALEAGIADVYQLEGGILKYFEECGTSHYKGGCFVFDERASVDGELTALKDQELKLG